MAEETLSSSIESSGDSTVTNECIQELLEVFLNNVYKAKNADRRYEILLKRCLHFFGRDYQLELIDNKQGQLCGHYPSEMIIITGHLGTEHTAQDHSKEPVNDVKEIKELFGTAKLARCRSRFVLPVILFEDKNICRSATLSTTVELYGRSGVEWILTPSPGGAEQATAGALERQRSQSTPNPSLNESRNTETEWALLSKVRGQDVQLMKTLGISLICDLMVEKKKLKYGVYVCSSEKVDKWARYSDFLIASMPYPGCEFFKDYKDNGYNPVSLQFNWKQSFIDAELSVPELLKEAIRVPCNSYESWDLVEITQYYFKMLMKHLLECEGGMLIHCISGWDRTPLFVSLLRLSLWADGCIHQSLCAAEILFLTLAYDWLLCGHQLKERHDKGEAVLYFCFDFLKYIGGEEYSVHGKQRGRKRLKTQNDTASFSHSGEDTHTTGSRLLSPLAFDNSLSSAELSTSASHHTDTHPLAHDSHPLAHDSHPLAHDSHPLAHDSYKSPLPPAATNSQCRNHSSTAHSSQSVSSAVRLRAQKLNEVRELFIPIYRAAIPEVSEPPPGALAGISGFFSRLAESVLNGPRTTV